MRFDLMTLVWIGYGLIVARMALRMADGGAQPLHFALMGGMAVAVAVLIARAGMATRRWRAGR